MRCTCQRQQRGHGWTHVGPDCPCCLTCWACCQCGWELTGAAAEEEREREDLVADLVAEIHATAAGHHSAVKGRVDGFKANA